MQSISELKKRGFAVRPAADAIGCTEVRFSAEFHYFNPKWLDDAANLAGSLNAADGVGEGQYRIIVAGTYADSDAFPFVLMSTAQVEEVRNAHSMYEEAKEQRDAATKRVGEAGAVLAGLLETLAAT